MAKPKSSLFSSMASIFSTSAPSPMPSSFDTAKPVAPSTQYNKATSGESFDGEKELVSNVFSAERLQKMHRLAKDHQNALTASDIIDLRSKMGATVNKSLVSDYSKYVSMKEQSGEASENFLKWLNIKTGPSMMEAPSMFVLQQTQPGKAVNKVEIREFGPSGVHYGMTTAESETVAVDDGGDDVQVFSADNFQHEVVTKEEMAKIRKLLQDRSQLAAFHIDSPKNATNRPVVKRLTSMRRKILDIIKAVGVAEVESNLSGVPQDASKLEKSRKEAATIMKAAQDLINEFDEELREINASAKLGADDIPEASAPPMYDDVVGGGVGGASAADSELMSVDMQTELVNQAADALLAKQNELDKVQKQMDQIKKHLKSTTGTRSTAAHGKRADHMLADQVHSLCKQLMAEREKNEALMAQSVGGGATAGDAASSPLLQKAMDSLSLLNEQKKQLEHKVKDLKHDNSVFSKDMKDLQGTVNHYKATANTLMGQNMDLKKAASREQYEKEAHRSRAADLSQKLASTLHYHFTDEDGSGNATVFLKAKEGGCCCEEFDQAAARNEVEGALLVGSTPMMLNRCRVGERAQMEIHNCSALTDASSGEVVNTVEVERMSDRSDGTVRGRLLSTIMLGKHSIQSEILVTGENQDHYALTLNAK